MDTHVLKYVLLKPVPCITYSFNLTREIIAVFSPYDVIEPRVIDAIDTIDCAGLRTEEVCSIIISKDPNVENNINTIVKSNQESRIIVPFTYEELKTNSLEDELVTNKLRRYFYSRDLFGIQEPLKKETFFFGRNELIQELVNKHLCGENTGLFGLRKTGKTSIIYGVKRFLDKKESVAVIIDCQTLHLKTWNEALLSIIQEAKTRCEVKKTRLSDPSLYNSTSKAADVFASDIANIYYNNGRRSILFIFDEIENICFDTSASENWKSGNDFVIFWQVLRSTFQHNERNFFTYLISGTNPACIERPTINGTDNPIFAQFKPQYISPFDFDLTSTMVAKLGGYMGLSFDPLVCARLVEDYGGHPMLIRQICSFIHQSVTVDRPFHVDSAYYDDLKLRFDQEDTGFKKYVQMVLDVLAKWYKDEYEMLELLALGDYDTFDSFAKESSEYTAHLIKYGLIEYSSSTNKYIFKVNSIKNYLCEKNKYKRVNLSNEDKQQEISFRRNRIEPKLRDMVRIQLRSQQGEETAKQVVIKHLYGNGKVAQYSNLPYRDFFNPDKHKIFLLTLVNIIQDQYPVFQNIFQVPVDIFRSKIQLINFYRKPDAHASQIDDNDFMSFRGAMGWLENIVDEYE